VPRPVRTLTANIASPPHQYREGITGFQFLVGELSGDGGSTHDLQSTLDEQSVVAAMHGIAALPPALHAFPWLDETTLARNMQAKIVGRPTKEEH
jgi:hypothetical protein